MFRSLLAGAALAVLALPAHAAIIDAPLPVGTYISFGGLEWAWAFPLPGDSSLLTYQSQFGWRLPTAAELAAAPLATDFLIANGNVPFGGSDPVSGAFFAATNANYVGAGACATPYFSSSYLHCDWQDGNGQTYGPWAGSPGAYSLADQLYVRDGTVPEPATWAMLIAGFGLVGTALRRRTAIA